MSAKATMCRVLSGAIAVLMCATATAAGDPGAGKAKAVAVCAACHGADGNSVATTFPRLAGQHRDYLLHSLQAYRLGTRKNEIMKAQVASLSVQDMENLAAYFSGQNGLVIKR